MINRLVEHGHPFCGETFQTQAAVCLLAVYGQCSKLLHLRWAMVYGRSAADLCRVRYMGYLTR